MFSQKSHSILSSYTPLSGISSNLLSAWTKLNLWLFFKNPYHHLSVTPSCTEVPPLTLHFLCHICLGTISKPCCLCSLPHRNQLCFVSFNFFSLLFFIAPISCQSNTLMLRRPSFQLVSHLPVWTSLPTLIYQLKFLSLHAKPIGRNPRTVPIPCSYNYIKHLSNLAH